MEPKPSFEDQIIEKQKCDFVVSKIKRNIANGVSSCFSVNDQGHVYLGNCLVVPKSRILRRSILHEVHEAPRPAHPGSTDMYRDIRRRFWWAKMKLDIAQFVAECNICRLAKAKYQKPLDTIPPTPIPVWKWDEIEMNFLLGLP